MRIEKCVDHHKARFMLVSSHFERRSRRCPSRILVLEWPGNNILETRRIPWVVSAVCNASSHLVEELSGLTGTEECTRQVVKLICTTSYTFLKEIHVISKNKSTKILSPHPRKKKTPKSLIPMGIFSGPQTLREMFPNAP